MYSFFLAFVLRISQRTSRTNFLKLFNEFSCERPLPSSGRKYHFTSTSECVLYSRMFLFILLYALLVDAQKISMKHSDAAKHIFHNGIPILRSSIQRSTFFVWVRYIVNVLWRSQCIWLRDKKNRIYNPQEMPWETGLFNLRNALPKTKNQHLTFSLTPLKQNFLFDSSSAPRLVFLFLFIDYFYLLIICTETFTRTFTI